MSEEAQVLVIDNGSSICKAGFASDESPRSFFPSIVDDSDDTVINPYKKDTYIRGKSFVKTNDFILKYPIKRGIITNWDDMEKIWHHIFYNELRVDPEEHPVLLSEVPMNLKANREKMTQLMFETFKVPSLYVGIQAVLSIFSSGRTTGIVFESGDGVSQTVPIYEGYSIPNAIKKHDLAGCDITNWLKELLHERGYTFHTLTEKKIICDIKENHCYVALDYDAEHERVLHSNERDTSYISPGGQSISIPFDRFRCPELLFKPFLRGFQFPGIDQNIFDSITKCDFDVHKYLFSNIVLSGGTTMLEGLPERIEKEIIRLAPPTIKIKVVAEPERQYAAWRGGAILASLDTFPQMAIDRGEYDDVGYGIVHSKCL